MRRQVAGAPDLASMRKLLRSQGHKRNAAVALSAPAERLIDAIAEDPSSPQTGSADIQVAPA